MSPIGRAPATPRRGAWHTPIADDSPVAALLSASAVRESCRAVFATIERGESEHFLWRPERLAAAADRVVDALRPRPPAPALLPHGCWRLFEAAGVDRWGAAAPAAGSDRRARARARCELALARALLDAGATGAWRYVDVPTATSLAGAEGIAVATLRMYLAGFFSADRRSPLRIDAAALATVDASRLGAGFGAGAANPLPGLAARVAVLRRLGEVATATTAVFDAPARLGHLFDHLEAQALRAVLPAAVLLRALLRALAPAWPSRLRVDGIPLGDCWRHAAARVDGAPPAAQGFVALHRIAQWLAMSLVEPLEEAGISVTGQDELSALADERNGGLLLDAGVLVPRDPAQQSGILRVHDPAVVEWRAATVAGLGLVAERVRKVAEAGATPVPPRVLAAATWSAARQLASELRPGGAPPLCVDVDGGYF